MYPVIIWNCEPEVWLFVDHTKEDGTEVSDRLIAVGLNPEGRLVPFIWRDPEKVAVEGEYTVREPK